MTQGSANSFFRFVLGFTLFIALSFGVTYAVSTYAIREEKEKQTAAAFQIMIGNPPLEKSWWKVW